MNILAIAVFMGVSFFVEYYVFAAKLNFLDQSEKGITDITGTESQSQDFQKNSEHGYVSQSEQAFLVFETGKRYVHNLELELPADPKFNFQVKYIDANSHQEITVEKKQPKSLINGKMNFLRFYVYHIDQSVEKIIVQAVKPNLVISGVKIDNSYIFNWYRFNFILAVGLLLWLFFRLRKRIGQKPELMFLGIALICGTLISFSESRSFVSWDEFIHYNRTQNKFLKKMVLRGKIDIFSANNSVPHSDSIKEQTMIDHYYDQHISGKESKAKKYKFSLLVWYERICYLPSGIVLFLGRLIMLPNHLVFILGRWINLLLFSIVTYFAIKKLPSGKMIMSVIALFPTSIFLASNYNYDSWLNAFSLLGLAYVFSAIQQPEKQITKQELAIIFLAFIIGLSPKAIYFPLMFLLFFIRPEKFPSFKQFKKFRLVTWLSIIFVAGTFFLPIIFGGVGDGDGRGGPDVNSTEQVKFILHHPIEYGRILANFLWHYLSLNNSVAFMVSFAYLGIISGFLLVLVTLAVVIFTDKNEHDEKTTTPGLRWAILGIFLSTASLIASALYVSFTAVRSPIIAGVQPRYLIPLLFPLFFVLGSSRIKNNINKTHYHLIIFGIMALVLMGGIWDLVISLHY